MVDDSKLEILMQSRQLVHTSYEVGAIENRIFYKTLFLAQKEKDNSTYACTLKLEQLQLMIGNKNKKSIKISKLYLKSSKAHL